MKISKPSFARGRETDPSMTLIASQIFPVDKEELNLDRDHQRDIVENDPIPDLVLPTDVDDHGQILDLLVLLVEQESVLDRDHHRHVRERKSDLEVERQASRVEEDLAVQVEVQVPHEKERRQRRKFTWKSCWPESEERRRNS